MSRYNYYFFSFLTSFNKSYDVIRGVKFLTIVFERRNRYTGKRSRIHSSKKKAIEQVFDSKDKLTEETKIKYNRRGQVVLMNKKNLRKDTTSKTVFKYKYDKRGNWVEQKAYCDKLLMAVRERVIVY